MNPPILVLKCKGSYDSFKFEDRQVQLDPSGAPVKVGRSQGALKPRGDNAIFECRVLSRSHAQVWCEESLYFIKDTGSSNGTFVNQQRVHQEPVQIKSGDVLQFGVDVDNNPKHTYWCVVTQIMCGEQNYAFGEADWDVGINQYTKVQILIIKIIFKLISKRQTVRQRRQPHVAPSRRIRRCSRRTSSTARSIRPLRRLTIKCFTR